MSIGAIFPGQGAQSVGMLADLAQSFPVVQDKFSEASDVLGFDLWRMVQDGPAEDLSATQNTQPILLTASAAVWSVWQQQAELPALVAGHSLGEYSALACAGAIPFAEAVALVRLRGELMEKAVPRGQGAMAAVMGLENDQVREICEETEGVVVAANFNAPGQVVIAGAAKAVELASENCKSAGAKRAVMLDVSGPFHSPLMAAAKDEFAQALNKVNLNMPQVPVVQNVDAKIAVDLEQLKSNLLAQISAPVLWSDCVLTMVSSGVDRFVECGPGKVLAGLTRRISKTTPTQSLATPDGIAAALVQD
ncbi:MAG: [acyl-carrier-protein] S-malonyltransferase [Candidatus Azotimanducaceae bacterium]|jgi:[acyl-carrier-protein] S-malonyltransferase